MTIRKDHPASFGYPNWYEQSFGTMPWRDWGLYYPQRQERSGGYISNQPLWRDNNFIFPPIDQQMPEHDWRGYQPPQRAELTPDDQKAIASLLGWS